MTVRLAPEGVRRAWVRAQGLDPATAAGTAGAAVAAVVGVQAQDLTAAELAVRARTRAVVAADVRAGLGTGRSLVLTWSLRGTRQLHVAEDVRWIVGLLGPRHAPATPGRNRRLGVDGELGDRAVGAIRDVLRYRGSLTRTEITEHLADLGVDPSGQAPVHLLKRARMKGVLCVLPSDGGGERYALLDDWGSARARGRSGGRGCGPRPPLPGRVRAGHAGRLRSLVRPEPQHGPPGVALHRRRAG